MLYSNTSYNVYYVKIIEWDNIIGLFLSGLLLAWIQYLTTRSQKNGHKKSNFYHTRNKIIPNVKAAAELLGVTEEDIIQMDKDGAPVIFENYLNLWDSKHIKAEGWDGWTFSRSALLHKKQRWVPSRLLQYKQDIEKIERLETKIYKMQNLKGFVNIGKNLIFRKLLNYRVKIYLNNNLLQ